MVMQHNDSILADFGFNFVHMLSLVAHFKLDEDP